MNLNDLDDVVRLRNHRVKVIAMLDAALSGLIHVEVHGGGGRFDPFTMVSAEETRDALANSLRAFLNKNESELTKLGVDVSTTYRPAER